MPGHNHRFWSGTMRRYENGHQTSLLTEPMPAQGTGPRRSLAVCLVSSTQIVSIALFPKICEYFPAACRFRRVCPFKHVGPVSNLIVALCGIACNKFVLGPAILQSSDVEPSVIFGMSSLSGQPG